MSSEAAPKTDGEETTAQIVLEDISGALPAVLAVGAALVYGLLIVAYSEFYPELGVRPSDVGLQYGPGIGGIAGVALLLVIAAAISLILFVAARSIVEALTGTELARRGRRVVIAASAAVLVVCLLGAVGFAMWANDRADDVKAGKVVEPYRFLGIELLSVRADLVHVKPTGSTADGGSVLARATSAPEEAPLSRPQRRHARVLRHQNAEQLARSGVECSRCTLPIPRLSVPSFLAVMNDDRWARRSPIAAASASYEITPDGQLLTFGLRRRQWDDDVAEGLGALAIGEVCGVGGPDRVAIVLAHPRSQIA